MFPLPPFSAHKREGGRFAALEKLELPRLLSWRSWLLAAVPTPQIQEGTMLVLHTICELVEHSLFGE